MERVMGIEPTSPAWEAGALPLSYTRSAVGSDRTANRGPVQARYRPAASPAKSLKRLHSIPSRATGRLAKSSRGSKRFSMHDGCAHCSGANVRKINCSVAAAGATTAF